MLNPIFSLSDIMKNIKGESSHWINRNRFIDAKFAWDKSYEGVSVSESMLHEVDRFISNQKEYHKNVTFTEERNLILKKFNSYTNKTV